MCTEPSKAFFLFHGYSVLFKTLKSPGERFPWQWLALSTERSTVGVAILMLLTSVVCYWPSNMQQLL